MTLAVSSAPKPSAQRADRKAVGVPPSSAALLRLQAVTMAQADFNSAALSFCSELADLTDAVRVSIGMIQERHTELLAVSRDGSESLDPAQRKEILAAMDEAIDQTGSIMAPSGRDDRRICRAAETLRRVHRGAVLTVPIPVHQQSIGALTLEFSEANSEMAAIVALTEEAATLFGPALQVLRLNERGLFQRGRDRLRQASRHWPAILRSPWHWLGLGMLLTLVALALIPMNHSVSAPARLEAAAQRVVTAPANGILKAHAVRPGEAVKQGQLVAELLDRDLLADRAKLQGDMAQQENAYLGAMARSDRTNLMIYQARLAEARAQSDLIDQQLKRVQLTAPIDGVVIQGDLSQAVGSPVEKGQVLMTIAPADAFRVIVELDERDVHAVRVGQTGRLRLSALPWDTVPVLIERITPMAVVLDGRNVFEIEAKPLQPSAGFRPGLRGVARVQVGQSPWLRVWGRQAAEHWRRLVWRWSP